MATTDASRPIHPKQILAPGWYWAFVDNDDAGAQALAKFMVDNTPNVFISRTQEGEATGLIFEDKAPYVWVLFEVRGTKPVTWTLPGFPDKAPKGSATLAKDIVSNEHRVPATTSPEHPFNKFFGWGWLTGEGEEDGSSSSNPLARAGESLRTAIKVVLYGGAAVILFQLFNATGGLKSVVGAVEGLVDKRESKRATAGRSYPALPAGR